MRKFTLFERALLAKEYLLKYQEMSKFPLKSPEEIDAFQLVKVKNVVELAYYGTRFYGQLYRKNGIHPGDIRTWADFEQLPTVTKDDIIDNHRDCIVDTRTGDKNLRVSRSSGSSGQMLEVIADTDRWVQAALIMLRMFRQSLSFEPFSRIALIYTSPYPFQSAWGLYRVKHLHTLTPPDELMNSLLHLRPSLIISYPSILLELTAMYPRKCNDLKVGGIATNSEHSTQEQRNQLSKAFRAPVYDEYSTEELSLVAFQCCYGKYHLQEDCVYLEILDLFGPKKMKFAQLGEIVGTSLLHNVMPFIRYRQGDLGSIVRLSCPCGNNGKELSDIAGRKNSSFKLPDGGLIPSGRVLDWTYKLVLEYSLPRIQYQVTQKTLCNVEVVVVARERDFSARHDRIIIDSFREQFGNGIQVSVRRVKAIPKTPAGKHIPILSLVK